MQRFFTHYWKNASWDATAPGDTLNHTASSVFRSKKVSPGDLIYIVTAKNGTMYVGGRIEVDRITSRSEAIKIFQNPLLWRAKDHIIARQSAQKFAPTRQMPTAVVRQLRFFPGGRLKLMRGKIDKQALRGVRELTPESAKLLNDVMAVDAAPSPNSSTRKLSDRNQVPYLIAKIGWMLRYNGFTAADPKVISASRYVKSYQGDGNEARNFQIRDGYVFGHLQRQPRSKQLNLSRIVGANTGSSIDGVLVVFIASNPDTHKQTVIGWYKRATVHVGYPEVTFKSGEKRRYVAATNAENAVLLPPSRRIPIAGPAIRHIFYPFEHGAYRTDLWIQDLLRFVQAYKKENWLGDEQGVIEMEATATAEEVAEQNAGFQSDPQIRRAVEDHAMCMAKKHFHDLGYSYEDTSKFASYDLICKMQNDTLHVEVKGTQTKGETVIVTKNEVGVARANDSVLFLVHDIDVGKSKKASGGKVKIIRPWAHDDCLTITHYRLDVVKASAAQETLTKTAKA